MPYNIEYHKDFIKFLKKHQDIQAKVFESFETIAQNPYEAKLDIKKLQGKANHYRLRISKYRFLYEVLESEILIYAYKADSRGDIYK
ncbi:type II toxin-antitoxin system RelE/ParE family toxin [Campylobacter upsaliensis]|uniref:Type II toxin-antitoxin system RelE/ParE family toxin n=1 Tax=Helicobacter zhangjianzhongii TaxID=2974574 RepID=A0ACC6FTX3_9HELI|nr:MULTISPECIES: type II toxin-antitoxin system RelE/ParE family toxin [Campylobacterales]EAI1980682.1 type II toxin-antitoxin system RelE/ParE family toxin [Campylobacter upsaliensis]EAK4280204.1 type II toxin-antitoxin system RelE/ParE family toxin [Campylobacter upsaliensis]ECV9715545.1 type II toxin-antitoxin system RelE/ParE family toxin [Campylobacter upsaliensis]EDP6901797.1 type II toxin-antitoxin system RelE/ParE family toxin [Campylobacter upsaliensis]EFS9253626.1 type II toxin-antit